MFQCSNENDDPATHFAQMFSQMWAAETLYVEIFFSKTQLCLFQCLNEINNPVTYLIIVCVYLETMKKVLFVMSYFGLFGLWLIVHGEFCNSHILILKSMSLYETDLNWPTETL